MATNKKIEDILKENPAIQLELLKDTLDDIKKDRKRKHFLIVLLVILLFLAFVYYEWSFKAFLSQYDYENTITTTTENNNEAKSFDKNNTINANISDIKINTDAKK